MGNFHKKMESVLELGSIFDPTLFPLYITDLPYDVIYNIAICADDIASDLWQELELASELEFYPQDAGLGQEVACCFQCWQNSTCFIGPV